LHYLLYRVNANISGAMALPIHFRKETLGYQIHTNRELGMMLRREKPLAVFSDVADAFPPLLLRYLRMFDRHVQTGRFVKREHREPGQGAHHALLIILYALPEEAWRIDAMVRLRHEASAWNVEHERAEGTLLGYSDGQNDLWVASRLAKR
jgi:hypothetical protein